MRPAPGIPRALSLKRAHWSENLGRNAPRDREIMPNWKSCRIGGHHAELENVVGRSCQQRSIRDFAAALDYLASLAMTTIGLLRTYFFLPIVGGGAATGFAATGAAGGGRYLAMTAGSICAIAVSGSRFQVSSLPSSEMPK